MKPRPHHPLPTTQVALLKRAERLSWWTVLMLIGTATLMYFVMGQSQAMKTAWAEDMVSLVPPVAFLIAARFARKPADDNYVNGRNRAYDIAFLVSAVALSGVGAWLVFESVVALIAREHPAIGGIEIFGVYIWSGWLMMVALALATFPPLLIGRAKLKLARKLHLHSVHTDAKMNKADWMTAAAGIAGVAGIGMGWWWADAGAALLIASDIVHDGLKNLLHAMRSLHDAYPETIDHEKHDPQIEHVRKAITALDWVRQCDVRLHDEGMRLCGVLFVTPTDQRDLGARLQQVREIALATHWRVDAVLATIDDGA